MLDEHGKHTKLWAWLMIITACVLCYVWLAVCIQYL
jgi:hypothetical protein